MPRSISMSVSSPTLICLVRGSHETGIIVVAAAAAAIGVVGLVFVGLDLVGLEGGVGGVAGLLLADFD